MTASQAIIVRARGVRKRFGRNEVLKGIDFEAREGEVTCIIGPSGGGKSTFLRCINHLAVRERRARGLQATRRQAL